MGPLEIAPGDARTEDVRALVERHLEFARAHTPPEFVFAVEAGDLADDRDVTLLCGRRDGRLLAIGAPARVGPRAGGAEVDAYCGKSAGAGGSGRRCWRSSWRWPANVATAG